MLNKMCPIFSFLPYKLSRFAGKQQSLLDVPKFHKGGPLQTGSEASPTNEKLLKSIIIFECSRHFMNPFEYGKSFLNKLFPKRFVALSQTQP